MCLPDRMVAALPALEKISEGSFSRGNSMREDLLCHPPPPTTFQDFRVWLGLTLNNPFTEPSGSCVILPPIVKKSCKIFPTILFRTDSRAHSFPPPPVGHVFQAPGDRHTGRLYFSNSPGRASFERVHSSSSWEAAV